ncbi:unnamed protein product [Mytilus coruscus]|uniref:Retrotransposon gag domain-containing protein n=1 Tax=Mytilus coruscus TaxID=42192 RepID=A0A6J8BED1_MYTCO|nr:unnamed protein product [Mytilus coruscus]
MMLRSRQLPTVQRIRNLYEPRSCLGSLSNPHILNENRENVPQNSATNEVETMTRVSGGNTPIFADESTMPRQNDSYNEVEITTTRQGDTIPTWEMNREANQSTLHTNNSIDNRRPINQSTQNTVPSESRETYQSTWSTGLSDNRDAYQSAWNTDHSDMRENPSTWSTDHSERRELNRTSGQSNREHQSTHSTVERERCEMNRHEQQRMDYSEVGRYQYVDTYPDHRQSSSQSSDSTHDERYPENYTRHSHLLRNMPDYTHTKSNYVEPQTYFPPEIIQPDRGTEYPRATADNMYSRHDRPRCPENTYSDVSNMSRMSSKEHRLPVYNDKDEWESFWCQFQIISRSYAWDNQKQATQLLLCLKDKALNFASRLPNAVQTDRLFVELMKRFGDNILPSIHRAALQDLHKQNKESLQEFAYRVVNLISKAYPEIKGTQLFEELTVEHFLYGPNDENMTFDVISKQPKSIDEDLNMVIWHESCRSRSGKTRKTSKREVHFDSQCEENDVRRLHKKQNVTEERLNQFGRELKDSIIEGMANLDKKLPSLPNTNSNNYQSNYAKKTESNNTSQNTFRSFKLERAVPVGKAIAPNSNGFSGNEVIIEKRQQSIPQKEIECSEENCLKRKFATSEKNSSEKHQTTEGSGPSSSDVKIISKKSDQCSKNTEIFNSNYALFEPVIYDNRKILSGKGLVSTQIPSIPVRFMNLENSLLKIKEGTLIGTLVTVDEVTDFVDVTDVQMTKIPKICRLHYPVKTHDTSENVFTSSRENTVDEFCSELPEYLRELFQNSCKNIKSNTAKKNTSRRSRKTQRCLR